MSAFAQDLKVGAAARTVIGLDNTWLLYGVALPVEFNLKGAMLSVNTEPSMLYGDSKENPVYTLPFFLKLNFGKKFKVSPLVGIYFRSNKNNGAMLGLEFSYASKQNFEMYLKSDFLSEYYDVIKYSHSGNYTGSDNAKLLGFSLGFRYNLFKKTNQQ